MGRSVSSKTCKFGIIGKILVWGSVLSIWIHPALPHRQWLRIQRSSWDPIQTIWHHHLEGNGHSECSHQTLVNSILWACGEDASHWLLYVHTGLWAMHYSTSWVTKYPPYFLFYGCCPFFAFDFVDKTWDTLDWHGITSTEDLLMLWLQQILWWDKKLVLAMEQQKKVCQQAVDDFNHKHVHYLSSVSFVVGTWVLLHKTWLDSQMGHKGVLQWTGPYIVHHQLCDTTYQLRELDGTVMQGSVAANCLKVFLLLRRTPDNSFCATCWICPTCHHGFFVFSTHFNSHQAHLTKISLLHCHIQFLWRLVKYLSWITTCSSIYQPSLHLHLHLTTFIVNIIPLVQNWNHMTTIPFDTFATQLLQAFFAVTSMKPYSKIQTLATSNLASRHSPHLLSSFFFFTLLRNNGASFKIFSLLVEVQSGLLMPLSFFFDFLCV